jgi:lipopolysaccharide export system permease protein
MSTGEKWAKEEIVTPFIGIWLANFILIPFGFFFLRQARLDARLFDTDFYSVVMGKIKDRIPLNIKKHKAFALFNR